MKQVHRWKSFVFQNILSKFDKAPSPRYAVIDISHNCNLECTMCVRKTTRLASKNMSKEEFLRILEQIPTLKKIIFVGGGETLMNPYVYDFFRTRGLDFHFVTNGLLLTKDNINRLTNVSRVNVSIDSPNPDTYKSIRGVDLEKVLNNLRMFKTLRKDIRLSIQAVAMKSNIHELDGFVDLCREVKADELVVQNLIGLDEQLAKQHIVALENSDEILQRAYKYASGAGLDVIITPLLKPRICFEPWVQPRINIDGSIFPCCFISESGEAHYNYWEEWCLGYKFVVPQYQYRLGYIFSEPFADIWNGPDYRSLRRAVRSANNKFFPTDELRDKVAGMDLENERFLYCDICFYRHSLSC